LSFFSSLATLYLPPLRSQGVAPFRAFVQDRVALARKAKEKDGPNALDSWGTIDLFYGCRRSTWDFLYKDEWDAYAAELGGKFKMHCAFSREEGKPKVYVQQLLRDEGERIGKALTEGRGYAYIWCVVLLFRFLFRLSLFFSSLLTFPPLLTAVTPEEWPRPSRRSSPFSSVTPRVDRSRTARRSSSFSKTETASSSMSVLFSSLTSFSTEC
jgi:hypothetical protein